MDNSIMFQLLKASLFTGVALPLAEWQDVFTEMEAQTVASLPGAWLEKHPIPGAEAWTSYCAAMQGQWLRVMLGQQELTDLLEQNQISFVILKGSAAAMYYPEPSLRSMGDVDFLVKRSDVEKAAALLESNGYILAEEKKAENHHYSYKKDNITYELHRKIPLVEDSDEKLLLLFETGIDQRTWHETEGFLFPVLPPLLNGMVLICHINQHLRSGLGLRQIIDWMMYMLSLSVEEREALQPLLREIGMERLALTVTAMCQQYLGLPKIVEEDTSYPTDKLMNHILEKGNFGVKAVTTDRIALVSLLSTTKVSFFKRLQEGGLDRWKAARKHRALRPFAWIYQSFRILGLLVKNRITPKEFQVQLQHGAEQFLLMKELGLQADRQIRHEGTDSGGCGPDGFASTSRNDTD